MSSKRVCALLAGACALLCGHCGHDRAQTRSTTTNVRAIAAGTRVRFFTQWSWAGAQWDDEAGAYTFTTDRGTTVRLQAAYVGTATLELVPCAPSPPAARANGSIYGSIVDLFAPPTAAASHGYVNDASLVSAPFVDSAFEATAGNGARFGEGATSGAAYCQLHLLVASLDDRARDGFHLDHGSAYVRGDFTLAGEHETHSFEGKVSLRGGALVALSGAATSTDAPPRSIDVIVHRNAPRAFDGIAFEKLSSSEIAYAFIRGLAKATSAEARPTSSAAVDR